ncbi:MAG: two-component sensor histidine kinase [Rhizobiales bacterium]|nr:two-component sensor histidine kinase [Hyphomicrobiales bacterium]
MTTIDAIRREYERYPPRGIRRMTRWFTKRLPTRLYARTLLIIIIPIVLLQSVVAFVFMERHWQTVTQRLSMAVTRDIAAVIDMIDTFPQDGNYDQIVRIARERLELNVAIDPAGDLPPPRPKPFFSILDQILSEEITRQIQRPFWIDTVGNSRIVEIRIQLDDKILRVFAKRSQAYASNTHIFLLWMVGTSLVLLAIAILFLRGQIRPILKLTQAAESFGKGQKMPEDFRPRGADEIRRAGLAFIQMRERIERQMEQRTAMLSGVSHDLRTILTRFRLQLALVGDSPEIESLNKDVDDMQSMLDSYLSFARSDAEEDVGSVSLTEIVERVATDGRLRGATGSVDIEGEDIVQIRADAFNRMLTNLVANACRHADHVDITVTHRGKWLTILVDDDGPGIPKEAREDVFRPFFRLDEARNQDESGTGLGLSIVRDIARSHGGDVTLSESPKKGLRAQVRLPV